MRNRIIYVSDELKEQMDRLPNYPWTAIAVEAFLQAVETNEAAENSHHNPREVWEYINSPEAIERMEKVLTDPLSVLWPEVEKEFLAAKREKQIQEDEYYSITP